MNSFRSDCSSSRRRDRDPVAVPISVRPTHPGRAVVAELGSDSAHLLIWIHAGSTLGHDSRSAGSQRRHGAEPLNDRARVRPLAVLCSVVHINILSLVQIDDTLQAFEPQTQA